MDCGGSLRRAAAGKYGNIQVSVRHATNMGEFNEVLIPGNKQGLIKLATEILRIAHTDQEGSTSI